MKTPSQLQRNTVGDPSILTPLTYAYMSSFAVDIKSTFSAAMTDLKSNLLVLTEKMAATEIAGKHREKAIHRLKKVSTSHSLHFIEINRHLEDLDNRGRRNNIRGRGIPESVETEQITLALQRVFNSLLERPENTAIEFVRVHRALRARVQILCHHATLSVACKVSN